MPQVGVVRLREHVLEFFVDVEHETEHVPGAEVLVVTLERLELAQDVVGRAPSRRKGPHRPPTLRVELS